MSKLRLVFVLFFCHNLLYAQSIITIKFPVNRSVFQRDANNQAEIYIAGNFTQKLDYIEAKLVPVQVGQGVATDWVKISDKPNNGSFVGKIKGIGGWYSLQLRALLNGQIIAQQTISRVGIGEVFVIAGQSNAEGKPEYGAHSSLDDRVNSLNYLNDVVLDETPPFSEFSHLDATTNIAPRGVSAWCWGELGDKLANKLNVPILFFNVAYGGTTIQNWFESANDIQTKHITYGWNLPKYAPYTNLRIVLQYYINQLGLRAVLWHQGESETSLTTETYYRESLLNIINQSRKQSGKNMAWVISRASLNYYNSTPTLANVINAQNNVINPNNYIFEGPYTDSLQINRPDGVHFKGAGLSELSNAWYQKLNDTFFQKSIPFTAAPIIELAANCKNLDQVTISLPYAFTSQTWSNKEVSASITTNNGTYTCIPRDQTGNYYFSSAIDINGVLSATAPQITADGEIKFCPGKSIKLSVGTSDYTSFIWNNGEKSNEINVNQSGKYFVRGIDKQGCGSKSSNEINVEVFPQPAKPSINQSATAVCEGGTITLTANNALNNIWSTGETTSSVLFKNVGEYSISLKAQDNNNCLSESSEPAIFSIKALPETPEITQIGAFTLQAKQKLENTNFTYEWIQDGKKLSNNAAIIKVSTPSFLTVAALQSFSIGKGLSIACKSKISGAFSFSPSPSQSGVVLYPIPVEDGQLFVEAKDNIDGLVMRIYTLKGQLVHAIAINPLTQRRVINLNFLENGQYIIHLNNGVVEEKRHIIVRK